MLSVAALLAAVPTLVLLSDLAGSSVGAVGVLGLAFALFAWRFRLVVPAVLAVPLLLAVEAYLVTKGAGDGTGSAVLVLIVGVLLLLLTPIAARSLRGRALRPMDRGVLPEEVLLVLAAVLALVTLSQPSGGPAPFVPGLFGAPPLPDSTFAPFERSAPPLPTFPTFPSFPTFPPQPTGPPFPTFPSG
jgi:hypothetical protein